MTRKVDRPPLRLHLIRHGRVASHRGDIPVTEEGLREVEAAARSFAQEIEEGEIVSILTTATQRARQTADTLYRTLRAELATSPRAADSGNSAPAGAARGPSRQDGGPPSPRQTSTSRPPVAREVELRAPAEEPAIRNPDLYIGGLRVEMVSTAAAMAEQTGSIGLKAEQVDGLPFYREFFPSPDRVGYWVSHPDPPGENAEAVARRIMAFAASLQDVPSDRPRRYLCVSHSPILRAFLRFYLLEADPGEPEFMESVDLDFGRDSLVTMRFRETVTPPSPPGRMQYAPTPPAGEGAGG